MLKPILTNTYIIIPYLTDPYILLYLTDPYILLTDPYILYILLC